MRETLTALEALSQAIMAWSENRDSALFWRAFSLSMKVRSGWEFEAVEAVTGGG